jgi:hypothetical protein
LWLQRQLVFPKPFHRINSDVRAFRDAASVMQWSGESRVKSAGQMKKSFLTELVVFLVFLSGPVAECASLKAPTVEISHDFIVEVAGILES